MNQPIERLSLNQYTTRPWTLPEAVDGCVRAGVPWIGLWRDKIAQTGSRQSAQVLREAGVRVSSLCRGGFFTASTAAQRQERMDDNRRAVDEAAAVGTDLLVLVCGGTLDLPLDEARKRVEAGIAELIPHAARCGVKLGLEPLHPMFGGDRSVVVTLGQANDIVARLGSRQVGVVIDVYHVWWDPRVYAEIERAAGTILGFHVNDWLAPPPDVLMGRGMMGEGVIELRRLRRAVDAAGYTGPIEVEIFNQEVWDTPGDEVLARIRRTYQEHVL